MKKKFLIPLLAFIFIMMSAIVFHNHLSFVNPKTNDTLHAPHLIPYVDNKLCLQCHQPEAKAWATSHHALAMANANPTSVLGNFENTSYKRDNVISHFSKRNNKFYVNTQGQDGKYAEFEIKYTLGVDPLQQYLIELPGGRLQNFTVAWDTHHQKWFDLYPHEKTPPGDVLHWTGRYQNANMMCIGCHTTNFKKNYDKETDSYSSTWSQMNVSCQACHGPGEHHINWAKAYLEGKNIPLVTGEYKGLVVDFKQGNPNTIVETCGICHSRRSELTGHSGIGEPLMDNYLPALITDALYYLDGQQKAEVYVYNSFRQSKMYQMGVSCVDCHNPHTGKLKFEGNAVCTQCHSPLGDKRFPTAAKLYDSPSHTFHKIGTPGAQCISCHMPAKNYMIIHARPDHSIRIPRPDLSTKLNTPNACTTCHNNKTPQWATDWITKWYGKKAQRKKHYGETLSSVDHSAEQSLVKLASDSSQPNVIRATALTLLTPYGKDSIHASIEALHNTDPAIRREAISNLEKISPAEQIAYITPLLSDPILAVRIEAAHALSFIPLTALDETQTKAFHSAINEYISAMKTTLDMPGSNYNLAVLNENMGNLKLAEEYYINALHIDPNFTLARINLASLYNKINRNNDAEKLLRDGINLSSQQGDLYYSLGLLLVEENRLPEAINLLKQAATLLPTQARVQYNYALALQQLGDRKKAEQQLLLAQQLEPNNSDFIYALVVFYSQDNAWRQALKWATKLEEINPTSNQIKNLVLQIKDKIS